MALPKLDWQTVAVETMPKPLLAKYNKLREQMEATNESRKAFEADLTEHIVKAKKLDTAETGIRFGWNWGKLSVAIDAVDKIRGSAGQKRETFTF